MSTKISPTFRRVAKGAAAGEVLIPLLRSYLHEPKFEGFMINVRGFEHRPPDGWFHPSTHPTWDERALYWYLVDPDHLVQEPFDYTSTLAVTMGVMVHDFIQMCLMELGIVDGVEVPVMDAEAGARGSMDGVRGDEVIEIKTMNDMKLGRLAKGVVDSPEVQESFRRLCPEYWRQGQTYMRMSGKTLERFLLINTAYPFAMREFVIHYDHREAEAVREKYLTVRQAVADQRPPGYCCGEFGKCPARAICTA
jgi:hypothetical protein